MIDRIQNPQKLDSQAILDQLRIGNEIVIQFVEAASNPKVFDELNQLCLLADSKLCVRFYGHYKTGFDCRVLRRLPNVKNLYLDCLQSVENFEELKNLAHLEKLNIGIFELEERDFLSWENLKNLSYLCLVESRKNNFDLRYLAEYVKVKKLLLNGHTKNIDAIGSMGSLTDVSLCLPSKASISFLNRLQNLRGLRFILGGRENLYELTNYQIEELEIIRVRGFSNFENLTDFSNLRKLSIEDQIQLPNIRFNKLMNQLEEIKLFNCKSLEKIDGLSNLSALKRMLVCKTAIDFDTFVKQELPAALKVLAFATTKKTLDNEIARKLSELGYAER